MPNKNIKNEIQCRWVISCANSSIDLNTNLLSIGNIVDELTINKSDDSVKQIVLPLEIIVYWQRDKSGGVDKKDFNVNLLSPEGEKILSLDTSISMQKEHLSFRTRIKTDAIPFRGLGIYKIQVVDKDKKKVLAESNIFIRQK